MAAPVFSFRLLPNKSYPSLNAKTGIVVDSLKKWSMYDQLKAQAFSYDQPFQSYQANEFVLAFMKDRNVLNSLQVVSQKSGRASALGTEAETVTVEMIPCTRLSMTFFDRLFNGQIIRESGTIIQCLDEYHIDFTISDELRKLLLLEESDHYSLYTDEERSEFLFRLFKHLCLGGSICQFEDNIQPYLDVTRAIYKDLVSVQKDKNGELNITSLVFKITASDSHGLYYPSEKVHEQNFTYLIVDPIKKQVNVLHHCYGSSVFG